MSARTSRFTRGWTWPGGRSRKVHPHSALVLECFWIARSAVLTTPVGDDGPEGDSAVSGEANPKLAAQHLAFAERLREDFLRAYSPAMTVPRIFLNCGES